MVDCCIAFVRLTVSDRTLWRCVCMCFFIHVCKNFTPTGTPVGMNFSHVVVKPNVDNDVKFGYSLSKVIIVSAVRTQCWRLFLIVPGLQIRLAGHGQHCWIGPFIGLAFCCVPQSHLRRNCGITSWRNHTSGSTRKPYISYQDDFEKSRLRLNLIVLPVALRALSLTTTERELRRTSCSMCLTCSTSSPLVLYWFNEFSWFANICFASVKAHKNRKGITEKEQTTSTTQNTKFLLQGEI